MTGMLVDITHLLVQECHYRKSIDMYVDWQKYMDEKSFLDFRGIFLSGCKSIHV